MKQIAVGFGLVTAIMGSTYAGIQFLDSNYTKQEMHLQLASRVEINELKYKYRDAVDEMYFYRQQFRKYPSDKDIQQKLRDAEDYVEELKKRLQELGGTERG